jgi:hypothetical protein
MSEENKTPLIESFLKLNERTGNLQGTQGLLDKAQAQQSANKAMGTSFGSMSPAPQSGVKIDLPGPKPIQQSAPPPPSGRYPGDMRSNRDMDRRSNPSFVPRPSPGADKLQSFQNVDKTNPIAAPGKLEGGNLSVGSRGDSVRELQRKLGIKDDGIFGPQTAAALKKFQSDQGLKSDSIYGKQTASAFDRISAMNKFKNQNPGLSSLSSNMKTPTAQRMYTQNYNRDRMESTEMTNPLIEAFKKLHETKSDNLFEKAKKLDKVGSEDKDIDNDGDHDKSDKYLHNRRKAIAKAMKEAIDPKIRPPRKDDPHGEGMVDAGTKAPDMVPNPSYATKSDGVNRAGKTSLPQSLTDKMKGKVDKPKMEEVNVEEDYDSRAASSSKMFKDMADKDSKSKSPRIRKSAAQFKKLSNRIARSAVTGMKEEVNVEFSEEELEHIAAVLEAVGPTPDEYSASAFGSTGSRSGTLSDTVSEEEEKKRGRGRPPGTYGAYKRKGEVSGGTTGGVTHIVDQIRNASKLGISDGKGNYKLKHITGYKTSMVDGKKVSTPDVLEFSAPQQAANKLYTSFHNTEKPGDKQKLTNDFVKQHSGKSLEAPKAAKPSLAPMPPKRS